MRLTYVSDEMKMPAKDVFWGLTDKEKQTLRLIVRGHDAKSIARSLGLSVHTINERLRDARRKMTVSSSREAARMLLDAESGDAVLPAPDSFVDVEIGEDAARLREDQRTAPIDGVGPAFRRSRILIGVLLMALALGLSLLVTLPQIASSPTSMPVSSVEAPNSEAPNSEAVDTARQWLALLDQSRWDESYRATGAPFRKLNTAQAWAAASETVRAPLGAIVARTFVSQENLPAPPDSYEVIKFRSRFANKAEAVETVTLDREDGSWRVVGVTVG